MSKLIKYKLDANDEFIYDKSGVKYNQKLIKFNFEMNKM
jgi:hypothetical protein